MPVHAHAHTDSTALRTLLRSLGQIVLQRHAGTGACVLAALAITDLRLACAAVMGAIAANVCSLLVGHDTQSDIRDGLSGFNGALAALAAFAFIADTAQACAVALLAAAATSAIAGRWTSWLRRAGLSAYSSPCLVVSWCWLLLEHRVVGGALAPIAGSPDAAVAHAAEGLLSGMAQTVFASGPWAGLLVLAGLAWSSPRAAAFALGGGALASALALVGGAPATAFAAGLLGFNGALAALAAGSLGVAPAAGAAALAGLLQLAALTSGAPLMTAPFVLAVWIVHGARLMQARRAPRPFPVHNRANEPH